MSDALVLVDIQNDYFAGGLWPVDDMARVATAASSVLATARAAGQHIIHIRHEAVADTAPFFRPRTYGAQIHSSVTPEPNETVILKHRPNSFHETDLHAQLQMRGVRRLTVVGAMSQMCIDATVRAAGDLGYEVTVVADACGAKSTSFRDITLSADQVQAAFMSGLAQAYATVI